MYFIKSSRQLTCIKFDQAVIVNCDKLFCRRFRGFQTVGENFAISSKLQLSLFTLCCATVMPVITTYKQTVMI